MPTTDHLVSAGAFRGFVTVLTVLLAVWALYDIVKWKRLKGADFKDPLVQDKIWGYVLGIIMGGVALLAALIYNNVV